MSLKAGRPAWDGLTVACLASGPSLTAEDCAAVADTGWPIIVTNDTFRLCPSAAIVFGFDARWWRYETSGEPRHAEVKRTMPSARRISAAHSLESIGVETIHDSKWMHGYGNSGVCSILLAAAAGAKRIILVGFDCQRAAGRSHWHGEHGAGLSNCASIAKWPGQFAQAASDARRAGAEVLNASRATALTCFPRVKLEEVIS